MPSLAYVISAAGLAGAVAGQYFPPTPEGLKVVNSKHQEGVKISYKDVCD
jgi:carboxypeptidase D